MDVLMPEMNGIEALERIRAGAQTSKTRVILLSVKSEDEDVAAGYRAGADYYLTKPFTSKQLLYGVRLVLGRPAG